MQAPTRWNNFLPSGIVLTTILALATFTSSTAAQNATTTQGDMQEEPALGMTGALPKPALDAEVRSRMSASYGKLPISFEVNQGQTDGAVQFMARGAGYTLFLTPGEAVLSLIAPQKAERPGRMGGSRGAASGGKVEPMLPSSTVRLWSVPIARSLTSSVFCGALTGKRTRAKSPGTRAPSGFGNIIRTVSEPVSELT